MFKIIKENENIVDKERLIPTDIDCKSNDGKISNESFYIIIERILHIMKNLQLMDSFSINRAGIIWSQTNIIKKAVLEIENQIIEHIEISTNIEETIKENLKLKN